MTQALAEVLNGSCWLMEQNAMRAMLARAGDHATGSRRRACVRRRDLRTSASATNGR